MEGIEGVAKPVKASATCLNIEMRQTKVATVYEHECLGDDLSCYYYYYCNCTFVAYYPSAIHACTDRANLYDFSSYVRGWPRSTVNKSLLTGVVVCGPVSKTKTQHLDTCLSTLEVLAMAICNELTRDKNFKVADKTGKPATAKSSAAAHPGTNAIKYVKATRLISLVS